MSNPSFPSQVRRFLKAEAFYVLVVVLVVTVTVVQTCAALSSAEGAGPSMGPVDQKRLREVAYKEATQPRRGKYSSVAFYSVVRIGNLCLLVAGTAAVLALVVRWLMRPSAEPATTLALSPPWGLWDVLKLAALYAGGGMLFRLIFEVNPSRPFWAPADWVAEIFARALLVGVVIHTVLAERGGRLADLGFRAGLGRAILVGMAGFICVQPFLGLIEAAEYWYVSPLPLQEPLQAFLMTDSRGAMVLATVVAVAVAPLSEELFFRGFLQPILQNWAGPWFGIFLSAAFFATAHMDLWALPSLLVLGVALGYVYHSTRSLAAPIALHVLFNAAGMITIYSIRLVTT